MLNVLRFLGPLLLACAFATGCEDSRSSDQVKILSEAVSPNGKFVASSFYCEGGGAAGFTFENVDLRRSADKIDQRNGLLGKHKTWSGFSQIELRWIDDSNLEISYSQQSGPEYDEHNTVRTESKYGIQMHYVVNGVNASSDN